MSVDDGSDSLARLGTEHFRIGMRFRVIALGTIASIHVVLAIVATQTTAYGDVDARDVVRFLVPNVGVHILVIALNLWALRRPAASGRTYANVARLSLVGETWTGATGLWLMGSLQSGYSSLFIALLIPVYRTYYGRELGRWALLLVMAFHGGLVALEALGVTTSGWGNPGYQAARTTGDALSVLAIHYLLYTIVWIAAAANAKRSEQLRALRQQLGKLLDKRKRYGPLSATLLDGRYELGGLLGRGGMGDVYRARDRHEDVEVAVKVLHPLFAEDQQVLQRFRREAETITRLGVAGVPKVHRVAVQPSGQSFIVMQLLQGESLSDAIEREGSLSPAQVENIVHGLALVLDRVHEAGVVHRDLKPSNVYIVPVTSGASQIYVLDFGVAKLRERVPGLTRTGMLLGTVGYIAPECVQHDSTVASPAADVFAMAAVAYEALTGEPAFSTRDLGAFTYDVFNRVPVSVRELVPELSPNVAAFFEKAWHETRRHASYARLTSRKH